MSQVNTVTISTEEYLSLKKFETAFMLLDENKKQVIKKESFYFGRKSWQYFVVDDSVAFKEIKDEYFGLEKQIEQLKENIDNFINMSIWEFVKFKIKNIFHKSQ